MSCEQEAGAPTVLIVEDEYLVAFSLVTGLEELGFEATVASTLAEAREIAESGDFIAAILDVRMPGGNTSGVAEILHTRGIPFLVSSAIYPRDFETLYGNPLRLPKPYSFAALRKALDALTDREDVQSRAQEMSAP